MKTRRESRAVAMRGAHVGYRVAIQVSHRTQGRGGRSKSLRQ
jgi:hypothetical protein